MPPEYPFAALLYFVLAYTVAFAYFAHFTVNSMNNDNLHNTDIPPDGHLFVVGIRMNPDDEHWIETGAEIYGWNMVSWEEAGAECLLVEEYFETQDAATNRKAQVEKAFSQWIIGESWQINLTRIENRDWAEYWKRFFHVERISEHIVIKPSWENYNALPTDCVIEIDPGMSFGTGQHPTTRTCLQLLDSMSTDYKGTSFLDLGCGSGVLSIAAAKLGYKNILGVDHDPLAVQIATENSKKNGTANLTPFRVMDLAQLDITEEYDVIVINMLANILIEHAANVVRLLKHHPHARLIIAGMMEHQYADVSRCYNRLGCKELEMISSLEWRTVVAVIAGMD